MKTNSIYRAVSWLTMLTFLFASGWTAAAQGDQAEAPLELLAAIEVGGSPDAIVVAHAGGRSEVIFYNRGASKVQFLDGDNLTLAADAIDLPTWEWNGWMAYDAYHHFAYLVTTRLRGGAVTWVEARVNVIASRQVLTSFSVNAAFNEGLSDPPDNRYGIDGLAFEQPFAEGANPGRLLIDNTPEGNLDVVDCNAAGTDAARVQRLSYRPPVADSGWATNAGNTLALETNHETLPADDLAARDRLYISDKNHAQGWGLRALSINPPLQDLDPASLPDVDLQNHCGIGGCQGIALAEAVDRLYVASGDQSFNAGYIDLVATPQNQLLQPIDLPYGDQYQVLVDRYDPRRVFVATFDHYFNDPDQALYLNLIYDEALVDTLPLATGFDENTGPRGMAFDPYLRRLYLTAGTKIYAVQVNFGAQSPAETAEVLVLPESGGELVSPDGRVTLDFPPGAVQQPTRVVYTAGGRCEGGELAGVLCFDLAAVSAEDWTPVTHFDPPYTVAIGYTASMLGPAIESSLGLYAFDGSRWQREPTSYLDLAARRVSAAPDHMTRFALLGETRRVLLPVILSHP